jgi:transcriptional regulator with XRE-family HTH domain
VSADSNQPFRCTKMNALAIDLNQEFVRIRTARRMTRKEFARATGIPASRLEKIEGQRASVSLGTLRLLAERTPEGKALAARIFQLDADTKTELQALLVRAAELAGRGT